MNNINFSRIIFYLFGFIWIAILIYGVTPYGQKLMCDQKGGIYQNGRCKL